MAGVALVPLSGLDAPAHGVEQVEVVDTATEDVSSPYPERVTFSNRSEGYMLSIPLLEDWEVHEMSHTTNGGISANWILVQTDPSQECVLERNSPPLDFRCEHFMILGKADRAEGHGGSWLDEGENPYNPAMQSPPCRYGLRGDHQEFPDPPEEIETDEVGNTTSDSRITKVTWEVSCATDDPDLLGSPIGGAYLNHQQHVWYPPDMLVVDEWGVEGLDEAMREAYAGKVGDWEEYFRPDHCLITEERSHTWEASVDAVIRLGGNAILIRQRFGADEIRLTLMNSDTLGIPLGFGPLVNFGVLFSAGANIEVAPGVTYGNGSTWVFDDAASADRFEEGLRRFRRASIFHSTIGRLPFIPSASDFDLPDPDITRSARDFSIPTDGTLGGQLGGRTSGNTDWKAPGLQGKLVINVQGGQVEMTDARNGNVSRIYSLAHSIRIAGRTGVRDWNLRNTAEQGALMVTRDAQENITEIRIAKGERSGDVLQEVTTVLPVTNPWDREIVQQWLDVAGEAEALPMSWDEVAPATPSGHPTAFEALWYERGITSRNVYETGNTEWPVAASVGVIITLGFSLGVVEAGRDVAPEETQYLGEPEPDDHQNPTSGEHRPYRDYDPYDCGA